MERNLPAGRWWNSPEMAQNLSLNSDQQKKMDDIFQQNRLRLIDLNATALFVGAGIVVGLTALFATAVGFPALLDAPPRGEAPAGAG